MAFHTNPKIQELLIIAILFPLIIIPRVTNLGLFLGHDEKMRNRQSHDTFLAITEGQWGDVESSNFGGTNLTWATVGAAVIRYAWLRGQGVPLSFKDVADYSPEFDPLSGAVFNSLIVILIYLFARKLFERPTAVVATAILALDPYLLAESRILRTEAAYATFIVLTIICLSIYVRTQRRRYLAWTGFWLAWGIATKISGAIFAPIISLVLAVMVWEMYPTLRQRLKHWGIDMIIFGGVTFICTFAIWPTLWVKPLETFRDLYSFIADWGLTPRERLVFFFMGDTTSNLPLSYYPLILLYKTTPLIWLGLGAFLWQLFTFVGQASCLSTNDRQDACPTTWGKIPFPLASGLIACVVGILYFVAMSFGTFKTERYMMAVVCMFDLAAAVGFRFLLVDFGISKLALRFQNLFFWGLALTIFIGGHGLFAWLNHPYYFSYYNPLLGGGRTAAQTMQVGSGEVVDKAINYLNHKPQPHKQIVVCGTNLPRCQYVSGGQTFLKRETMRALEGQWVGADYVVTYIFQSQRGEYDYPLGVIAYLEHHPGAEYIATFQGIDYAKVYPAPHVQHVSLSQLTGISTLLGYNLNKSKIAAGDTLNLKFYWENDGQIKQDMFVQLTDADNYIWNETTAPLSPEFAHLRTQRKTIIEGTATLSIPIGIPPGPYLLKMGYRDETAKLLGEFKLPADGRTIEATWPSIPAPIRPTYPFDFKVDESLRITGYDVSQIDLTAGKSLWLTLYWHASAEVKKDYAVNLRLLHPAGQEVTYRLGRPIRNSLPTHTWQAGQWVQDPWLLDIPPETSTGEYKLELVIIDLASQAQVGRKFLQSLNVTAK